MTDLPSSPSDAIPGASGRMRTKLGPGSAGLLLAVMLALGLGALSTPMTAALVVGALGGVTMLLLVAAVAPARLGDLLYVTLWATASIPIDKYFAYQLHVGGWPGLRFALSDFFLIFLALLAILGSLMRRGGTALPAMLVVPYLLLLLQYGASILGAARPDLSAFELAAGLHAIALAAVVAALFRRRHLNAVLGVVGFMVVVQSGLAIVQVVAGRPIGAGLVRAHGDVLQEVLATGSVRLRPSGFFDHPITFADFILVSLPLLAAGSVVVKGRLARLGVLLALAMGAAGLVLSLARGAWISSLVAGAVMAGLGVRFGLLGRRELRRLIGWTTVAAMVIAVVAGPRIYERLTSSQEGNLQVRFDLNDIALSMVADRPVLGVGLNNFLEAMPRHDPKDVMRYFPGTVHNLYLLEAAEAGIPGLLLFLAWGAGLLAWTWRRLSQVADPSLRWIAVGLLAGFAGFAVSQLADFAYRLEPLRTVLWCEIGLLVGVVSVGSRRAAP